jgi:hypothetical protein
MTASPAPAASPSQPATAAGHPAGNTTSVARHPSRPWCIAAFLLAGAAQLITISALTGVDHPPITWAALLLAVAPAPLAAIVAFGPYSIALPAAAIVAVVLIAGIAGAFLHIGVFFLPALLIVAVAIVKLWGERGQRA